MEPNIFAQISHHAIIIFLQHIFIPEAEFVPVCMVQLSYNVNSWEWKSVVFCTVLKRRRPSLYVLYKVTKKILLVHGCCRSKCYLSEDKERKEERNKEKKERKERKEERRKEKTVKVIISFTARIQTAVAWSWHMIWPKNRSWVWTHVQPKK